jgi:hypothetical protein
MKGNNHIRRSLAQYCLKEYRRLQKLGFSKDVSRTKAVKNMKDLELFYLKRMG